MPGNGVFGSGSGSDSDDGSGSGKDSVEAHHAHALQSYACRASLAFPRLRSRTHHLVNTLLKSQLEAVANLARPNQLV